MQNLNGNRSRLALYLCVAIAVYHLNNLVNVVRNFRGIEGTKVVELKAGDKFSLRFALPKPKWSEPELRLDPSRHALRSAGYMLRYLLGQENNFYFYGAKHPIQRMYNRQDITVMRPGLEAASREYLDKVTAWLHEAKCHGAVPIAAFVPPKSVIEREELPARLPTERLWQPQGPTPPEDTNIGHRVLRARDPELFVDLFKTFEISRNQFPEEEIYVPWDYHLTSYGMSLLTADIVHRLNKRGESLGSPTLVRADSMPPRHDDIIINMLHLPKLVLNSLERFNWREPIYEVHTEGKLTHSKRVVLLGTSFTERLSHDKLSFAHQLERALHVPVVSFTHHGATLETMLESFVGQGDSLGSGDIVVVEQPFDHVLRDSKPFPKAWPKTRALASSAALVEECLSFGK